MLPVFNPTVQFTTLPSNCNGPCSGSASVSVTGGNSPYTYSWDPGSGIGSTISNLCNNTYTVIISDVNGCTASSSVPVFPNTLTADAGTNSTICTNSNLTIGGLPVATNGKPPYTYSWSPSSSLNSTIVENPIVSGLAFTTSYVVTVTDNVGCTANDQVTINYQTGSAPYADAGPDRQMTPAGVCNSTGITILGTPFISGNTYNWICSNMPLEIQYLFTSSLAEPVLYFPTNFWVNDGSDEYEDFTLFVTNSNNCTNSDVVHIRNVVCRQKNPDILDGSEQSETSDINEIYPNPTSGILNFMFKLKSEFKRNISIYNSLGEIFLQIGIDGNESKYSVDLNNFKSGLYYCCIANDQSVTTHIKFEILK